MAVWRCVSSAPNPDVTVVIPGMYDVSEIEKNREAVEDTRPLTEEELAAMEQVRKQLVTNFCRRCNYCQPVYGRESTFPAASFSRDIWTAMASVIGQRNVMRLCR